MLSPTWSVISRQMLGFHFISVYVDLGFFRVSVATELDFSDSIMLLIFDPWQFCTAWSK